MLTLVLTTMMTAMPGAGGLNHPGASAVPNFAPGVFSVVGP